MNIISNIISLTITLYLCQIACGLGITKGLTRETTASGFLGFIITIAYLKFGQNCSGLEWSYLAIAFFAFCFFIVSYMIDDMVKRGIKQ